MKRYNAIAVTMLTSGIAFGANFNWSGAGSSNSWFDGRNWGGSFQADPYPGLDQSGDNGTISTNTARDTMLLNGALDFSVNAVLVDAATADVSLALQIASGASATFTTIGLVADSAVAYDATLQVTGFSSLSITNLDCTGAGNDIYGHAIADIQASTTVTTSTDVAGFVDFVIANSVTFDAGALVLSNAGSGSNLSIAGGNTSSQVSVDSYTGNSQPLVLVGPIILQQ